MRACDNASPCVSVRYLVDLVFPLAIYSVTEYSDKLQHCLARVVRLVDLKMKEVGQMTDMVLVYGIILEMNRVRKYSS